MATKKDKITSDAFAVITTGGKQYVVKEGDTVKIEKLGDSMKVGDAVVFDKVLLTGEGDSIKLGTPTVSGAKVNAKISEIGRDAKISVIHYKQKSRYFKRNGHRQPFFKVTIEKIA